MHGGSYGGFLAGVYGVRYGGIATVFEADSEIFVGYVFVKGLGELYRHFWGYNRLLVAIRGHISKIGGLFFLLFCFVLADEALLFSMFHARHFLQRQGRGSCVFLGVNSYGGRRRVGKNLCICGVGGVG